MKEKQKGLEEKVRHNTEACRHSDTERECNSQKLKKKNPHTFKNKFSFENILQKSLAVSLACSSSVNLKYSLRREIKKKWMFHFISGVILRNVILHALQTVV